MLPEGFYQRIIPMTPSGIETATFLLVAQCLNQLSHRVPLRLMGSVRPPIKNVIIFKRNDLHENHTDGDANNFVFVMSDRPEYQHSSSATFLSGSTSSVTCLRSSSLTRDGVFKKNVKLSFR